MTDTRPTMRTQLGVLMLSIAMLLAFLTFGAAPEADAQSGNPCPHYSIQDVFDDPNGNWDGDLVRNSDELYNGLNPCLLDTQTFCGSGGNALCLYPTYVYYGYADACTTAINGSPNGDYDGDGVSNAVEQANGANPCHHPCPNPSGVDVALNPNGSWDSDGISNAIEVSQGTNPCNGYYYNPCPSYTHYQVNAMPSLDWDRDGITNAEEVRRGYNPCQITTLPHVTVTYTQTHTTTYTQTHRLPHVVRTYQPPAPKPRAVCPVNYPYYHSGNGKCYANPVGPQFQ